MEEEPGWLQSAESDTAEHLSIKYTWGNGQVCQELDVRRSTDQSWAARIRNTYEASHALPLLCVMCLKHVYAEKQEKF